MSVCRIEIKGCGQPRNSAVDPKTGPAITVIDCSVRAPRVEDPSIIGKTGKHIVCD